MTPTCLIVFDVDGTLIDSEANIVRAMTKACGAHGVPVPSRAAIRTLIGLSPAEGMARLWPEGNDAARTALLEDYRAHFDRLRTRDGTLPEPLFEGMGTAVATLATAGFQLGIATGKSERGLAACLKNHKLSHHFITLQTADHHPSKPDPAMLHAALHAAGVPARHSVMVGDTHYDMTMATAAGVTALGVAWGYHSPADLRKAGADSIVTTPAALVDWIKRWRQALSA